MASRRVRSLHFNLKEGENVVYHRDHRAKKNRHHKKDVSLQFLRYKWKKKHGEDESPYRK